MNYFSSRLTISEIDVNTSHFPTEKLKRQLFVKTATCERKIFYFNFFNCFFDVWKDNSGFGVPFPRKYLLL